MKNFEDIIENLVRSAKHEKPPHVDVAGNVLEMIACQWSQRFAVSERQMMWVAVCSSAAAAVIVVAAVAAYYAAVDPITEVSQAISWVIQ